MLENVLQPGLVEDEGEIETFAVCLYLALIDLLGTQPRLRSDLI